MSEELTITGTPELLVLSGRGVRYTVTEHAVTEHSTDADFDSFRVAVTAARARATAGQFVVIRVEAAVINGSSDGTDRELARFEVFEDRVALVPSDQRALSTEQRAQALALPKRRLLSAGTSALTDAEREAQATRQGTWLLGPVERQRCTKHHRRWELFRWTWKIGEDLSRGEAVIVRQCGSCTVEDNMGAPLAAAKLPHGDG